MAVVVPGPGQWSEMTGIRKVCMSSFHIGDQPNWMPISRISEILTCVSQKTAIPRQLIRNDISY